MNYVSYIAGPLRQNNSDVCIFNERLITNVILLTFNRIMDSLSHFDRGMSIVFGYCHHVISHVCLSVVIRLLSVFWVYCDKTTETGITQFHWKVAKCLPEAWRWNSKGSLDGGGVVWTSQSSILSKSYYWNGSIYTYGEAITVQSEQELMVLPCALLVVAPSSKLSVSVVYSQSMGGAALHPIPRP